VVTPLAERIGQRNDDRLLISEGKGENFVIEQF